VCESCVSQLLHHVLSRAPLELPSPHKRAGLSASEYIMWMDVAAAGDGVDDAAAGADYDAESALQLQALFPTPAAMLRCETAVWQRIRSCADEYAQRVSAPAKSSGGSGGGESGDGSGGGDAPQFHPVYESLVRHGPRLLALLRQRLDGASSGVAVNTSAGMNTGAGAGAGAGAE